MADCRKKEFSHLIRVDVTGQGRARDTTDRPIRRQNDLCQNMWGGLVRTGAFKRGWP